MPTSKKVAPPKTRQSARNGGAVAPRKPRRAAGNAGTVGKPVGSGGVAGRATTDLAGGAIGHETGTSAHSERNTLGWFTADSEGVKVRFGIDPEEYFLDATATNYSAMFSMLLACWLEHEAVQITYATGLLNPALETEPPRRILSVVAFAV